MPRQECQVLQHTIAPSPQPANKRFPNRNSVHTIVTKQLSALNTPPCLTLTRYRFTLSFILIVKPSQYHTFEQSLRFTSLTSSLKTSIAWSYQWRTKKHDKTFSNLHDFKLCVYTTNKDSDSVPWLCSTSISLWISLEEYRMLLL